MQYGYKSGDGYKPVNDRVWKVAKTTRFGNKRVFFTPEQERMMGTISDAELAKMAGCAVSSVWQYRTKHGIPPHKPPKGGRKRIYE
jgi:hypothetical protein